LGTSEDWFLAFLIIILLMDITESLIYEQNNFAWVLLVTVAAVNARNVVIPRSTAKRRASVPRVIAQSAGTA
jgi:hypothetical protein